MKFKNGKKIDMKNKFKIIQLIGKNLTPEPIDFMIQERIREYGVHKKFDFKNWENESEFFFLKEDETIKAFGMLKPVTLYADDKNYQIMGIANILAVEKGKWYGTILINVIKVYLEKNSYVGLGSTHSNNFKFYEDCGFTFLPKFIEKIVYIDENWIENYRDSKDWDHEMFIFDKENQLKNLITSGKKSTVKIPFW